MHLYLLGSRGVGKSTVGKLLAQRLQRPFLDLDELIEKTVGMPIADLFRARGEAWFRELESQTLALVGQAVLDGQSAPGIVALGGGTCERPLNRDWIRRTGRGVWLRADSGELHRRMQQDSKTKARRPALTKLGSEEEIRLLNEQRRTNYEACAGFSLVTDKLSPAETVERIASWWESLGPDDNPSKD